MIPRVLILLHGLQALLHIFQLLLLISLKRRHYLLQPRNFLVHDFTRDFGVLHAHVLDALRSLDDV